MSESPMIHPALDPRIPTGWCFTPLNGKVPLLTGWQKRPPQTSKDLEAWCAKGNVGLRTGSVSGVVVIDVDGDMPDGLPETVTVRTGSGKIHLYYTYDKPLGNSASRLAPQVDIRGDGGQVVFPGSVHPDTGQPYVWERAPWDMPIAPLPQWVIDKLPPAPPPLSAYARKALDEEIDLVRGAPEGQRNTQLNRSAFSLAQLAAQGLIPVMQVIGALEAAAIACGLPETEAKATIDSGWTAGFQHPRGPASRPPPRDGTNGSADRPTIDIEGGMLPSLVDQAEGALLLDRGPRIYQRAGLLVRVIRTESPVLQRGLSRDPGALLIHPVEAPYLIERFTGAATWRKYDARSQAWKQVDYPERIVKSYMARRGSWWVAPLVGILEAPTLRSDGSILETPGYDEETRLFFDPGGHVFPKIPDHPSQMDAFKALEDLIDILKDFPFVDDFVDRMAVVAAILTGLVRKSLPSAPLFVFRAPKMRSGKSLLADIVSMIATGRKCSVMSQALGQERSNEERKRLLAVLLEGDPVVNFDNCEHALEGAALSMAITQETIKDRVLGISKTATASTAVTFLATGNNLVISGDLSARVVPCDLDPLVEHPEEREFDRDLYKFVPENRGRLVAAALTILRAYHVAGMPEQTFPRWGGFDEWSRWIRGSLKWIGQPDPTAGRVRLEAVDPIRQSLRPLLLAWYEVFQTRMVTVAEAVTESERHPALKAAFFDQAGDPKGGIRTKSLGRFLEKYADRIEGGFRIERAGERQGRALWRVRPVATA